MRLKLSFVLFFFLASLYNNIKGQSTGTVQFNNNDGLPSNTIYDITQDERGFIWFATEYGISKFDGLNFVNFTKEDGLSGNEVLYFYKDSQHRIWLIGFNGTVGFIKNGNFYNEKNTNYLEKLKSSSFLNDIYEDSAGSIWLLQNNSTVKVLKPDSSIDSFSFKVPFKRTSRFELILEDKNNNIHIFGGATLPKSEQIHTLKFDKDTQRFHSDWKLFDEENFKPASIKSIKNNQGMMLRFVNDNIKKLAKKVIKKNSNNYLAKIYEFYNEYWVTNTESGFHKVNFNTSNSSSITYLDGIKTTRAFKDSEGNIWVGSLANGVYFFPNYDISGVQFDSDQTNDLHSIIKFNDHYYCGNDNGEVLQLSNSFELLSKIKLSDQSQRVRQLKKYNDQLFILSDFNLHKLNGNEELELIKSMHSEEFRKKKLVNFKMMDFKDGFLISSHANGSSTINLNTLEIDKTYDKRTTSVLFINPDSILLGSPSGLLVKNKSDIKKLPLNNDFNNSNILDIAPFNQSVLICSNSHGLGVLSKNSFKTISKNDGLLSNFIKSIYVDDELNIWLSTNLGLNKLRLDDHFNIESLDSFTTSDGLLSNDVRSCIVDNNKVIITTSSGLNIFDLMKKRTDPIPPTIVLNELLVNDKITPYDKNTPLELKFSSNNLQFNFSGISYKSLGTISYKYRLLGLEDEWISTDNSSVRYSGLQPNDYIFELKAVSKSKIESTNTVSVAIRISKPVYKTWWFRVLALILIALPVYWIWMQKRNQKRREFVLNEKISALKYQALNAQMNPHFINNFLSNITQLQVEGKNEDVKKCLSKFAELVNLILKSTKSNLITLEEELHISRLYLELQKVRFKNKLNYEILLTGFSSEEIEYVMVPPMILQPILENCIKHGFRDETRNSHISIAISGHLNKRFKCTIRDNGKGLENLAGTSNHNGISLKNINDRLNLIDDSQERLVNIEEVRDDFNKLVGTEVTLMIPLISILS